MTNFLTGKKVIITGATGAVGKLLCPKLADSGAKAVVFSRDPDRARFVVHANDYVSWRAEETGPWATEVDGSYAVVGLAGAPFFRRWTPEYRKEVINSRVLGTRGLVDAMEKAAVKPRVFVSASSVGIYGYQGADDQLIDEDVAPAGDSWGQDNAAWEAEAVRAQTELGVRTVLLRTGILLSKNEGPMPQWASVIKQGWGGPIGPGNQWLPWIHVQDEAELIMFALEDGRVSGPLNCTAPNPEISKDFFTALGKVLSRSASGPDQEPWLRREYGDVVVAVTRSKRVIPRKALELGYRFRFPTSGEAFRDLV